MNLKGKKVVVTGAAGFIGSHLVESLVKEGSLVKAFVHYNSRNDIGWLNEIPKNVLQSLDIKFGDLSSKESVASIIKGSDIVFHLGALISIPYSYINPRSYFKTNVEGTINVLNACIEYEVKRVVHTSTSEVYGTPSSVPIKENHPLQAQSPYAASKIAADKIAESYYLSYNLPIITVRPFNTYGPRQSARAVIPNLITQFLTQDEIKIGSIKPTRDFNFVSDTVNGFIRSAKTCELVGDTVNIGSGIEYSIENIITSLEKIIGKKLTLVQDKSRIRPDKSEVLRLLADSKKLNDLTGWEPEVNLINGLEKTIKWTESRLNLFRPFDYNI
ncbi:GDP-mannose 4,6-dehydratase [Paraliobacillus sp. X-1268]|uniref:GDP-mannose 4,6-dehydratase n=1 Tax=Paraliobacillus sp. X-1268 TaxID=2213193 RepID=UPI000E3BEB88|nr:GDP-mannose 4,6-dehydratase [Paraliobacillus sp. X-1268]